MFGAVGWGNGSGLYGPCLLSAMFWELNLYFPSLFSHRPLLPDLDPSALDSTQTAAPPPPPPGHCFTGWVPTQALLPGTLCLHGNGFWSCPNGINLPHYQDSVTHPVISLKNGCFQRLCLFKNLFFFHIFDMYVCIVKKFLKRMLYFLYVFFEMYLILPL